MHDVWTIVNGAVLIFLFVLLVMAFLNPAERKFISGLLLMSVSMVGTTLRELGIIPPAWVLPARIVYVGLGIIGFVLILRRWRASRSPVGESP